MTTASSSTPPLDGPLLSAMVESLQDYAILMLDRVGRIESWNIAAARFKGWTAREIAGRSHAVFYRPEDRNVERPAHELELAARFGRFEEQHWRVRRDGSRFWANVVITPVLDATGELIGYGEVVRDVSDHYAAVHALRQSESRFRAVTESATDAIFSVGDDGRVTTWNAAAARLFGYTTDEAIGLPLHRLAPDSRREDAENLLDRARSAEPLDGGAHEGVALHADGTEIPVEVSFGSWEVGGVRNFSAIVRDITERKRAECALQHIADHDSLTGLFNRRRFEVELERIVSESERYQRRAALLVLDLDGFKEVNDRHGHSAGDEVIAKVGALLDGIVRRSDVVARLGGDEFGIAVQDADRAEAEIVAGKIIESLRSHGIVVSDLVRAAVTVSVGITLLSPDEPASAEQLLLEADRAMYEAKAGGRNRFALHHPGDDVGAGLPERHLSLQRLREALDNDGFELLAQPIVSMSAQTCPRYELLLRLRDGGELIAPGAFLDNAERFDLIGNIDRWVLGRAVELLHEHHAAGREISLTVNLSGKTMNDHSIVDDLRAMLQAAPVPPGRLVVEVTETAAIVNIGRAAELARDLRELGCDFALDDFGSGFASFYYLKHLDFDYLKIDGEFVARLVDTPCDQLVVRAVVDIARGLGSETIAEFVENEETLALLHELGVDYGQGYHLGRPEPLSRRLPALQAA